MLGAPMTRCWLISELATNACTHTASGHPGGTFNFAHLASPQLIHGEVEDQGSTWDGILTTAQPPHGLFLLQALSTTCGTRPGTGGWITWFTIASHRPLPPSTAAVITLDAALTAARHSLATVTERAERQGYYTGARTDIINSHAELRAALDLLIKAAEHSSATDPGDFLNLWPERSELRNG